MTGWRIGWLEAPASLGTPLVNLIQYSSSGTAVFVQRAAGAPMPEGACAVSAARVCSGAPTGN